MLDFAGMAFVAYRLQVGISITDVHIDKLRLSSDLEETKSCADRAYLITAPDIVIYASKLQQELPLTLSNKLRNGIECKGLFNGH